jgi:predicted ATPase
LHLTLGASLTVTQGWGAPEVAHAYGRARELCQQLGDPPQLFPVLWGLWSFDLLRAAYQTAQTASAQLLTLAQRTQDAALLVEAHFALGTTGFIRGDLALARAHLAQALTQYDPQQHRTLATLYSFDPQVGSRDFGGGLLWMLGFPDQAVQESQAALAWADAVGHPFSQAFARLWAAILHQLRREAPHAQAHADAAIALCTAQEAQLWRAGGTVFRGWARGAQGQAAGLAELRQGLTDWRRLGAEQAVTWYLGLLAERSGAVGHVDDGLRLVAEALALVDTNGEGFYTPELHRLQGELLLQQTAAHAPQAAACFQQALTVARHQRAKSWELRAAISLSRLWQQQGKRSKAHALLAPIYDWFIEGFDTADLQEARALLETWAG